MAGLCSGTSSTTRGPTSARFETGAEKDTFRGAHAGYRRLAAPVTPVRTIVLDHARHALTVRDAFEGAGRHRFEIPLHLAPGVAARPQEPGRVLLEAGARRFRLSWSPPAAWSLQVGAGRVSPSYGVAVPCVRLAFSREGDARARARDPDRSRSRSRFPLMMRDMLTGASPILVLTVSFVLAAAVTPLFRAAARRWGLLDKPNVRSSHRTTVPRGGGAAIVVATLFTLCLARSDWERNQDALAILLGGVALAGLGLLDDRFGLSPLTRLAAQIAVAVSVVSRSGRARAPAAAASPRPARSTLLAKPLAVLWIVAVVNFFNFLDGIDGLAGLQAVVTGVGILLAAWDPFAALAAAAVAGAAGAFLLFNWAPGDRLPGRHRKLLPGLHSRSARSHRAAGRPARGRGLSWR